MGGKGLVRACQKIDGIMRKDDYLKILTQILVSRHKPESDNLVTVGTYVILEAQRR